MCDECRQSSCDVRCPNNTEEEKEMYFWIFVNDVIKNKAYEEAVINDLLSIKK